MFDTNDALQPTDLIDAAHPDVVAFARQQAGSGTAREQAVALYYAVRDGFRYDPYGLDLTHAGLKASRVLALGHGWCVTKAALLAACCRATGIPATVGYADVRNHLSTERMRQTMQTDVFYWHGYTAIWLEGQWVKATPAFNLSLCQKFRLHPLEFDGRSDSIYHPLDLDGNRHMEYLRFRGEFLEVPAQQMREDFAREYPQMQTLATVNFDADVARETAG